MPGTAPQHPANVAVIHGVRKILFFLCPCCAAVSRTVSGRRICRLSITGRCNLPARLSPDMDSYPFVSSCIDQIDQIRHTFPHAYELLIKGKLYELFFLLYHHGLITPHVVSGNSRGHSQEKSLEKTRQILKFLEQHYNEPLSIEKLAKAAGFSQSHFMKFFKNTFGQPFTAYLNDYRLTMASRMLLASEDSILAIAAESGFENLSYFNRRFRDNSA